MLMLPMPKSPKAGADQLDQRTALRSAGQRIVLAPSMGPGPLVEPMDSDAMPEAPTLKPLQAAPMHVLRAPVSVDSCSVADRQRAPDAAADRVSRDGSMRAETACRQGVDLKAFTGKGEARTVRQAAKTVDDIHARMREAAQASARIGKNVLYLTVHARSATNQHALRWRGYTVVNGKAGHRHLTWDEAAERIRRYPYEVMLQLRIADTEARELNRVEQDARSELRRLRPSESVVQRWGATVIADVLGSDPAGADARKNGLVGDIWRGEEVVRQDIDAGMLCLTACRADRTPNRGDVT